jgi:hypothetical protein
VIDVAKCLVEQRCNVGVVEPVDDVAPTSPPDDEPEIPENSQLV